MFFVLCEILTGVAIGFLPVLISLGVLMWASRPSPTSSTPQPSPLETSLWLRILVAVFVVVLLATSALITLVTPHTICFKIKIIRIMTVLAL